MAGLISVNARAQRPQVEQGRLRFWARSVLLLEHEELLERMQMIEGLQRRTGEEASQLAEVERLRQEAEPQLAEATRAARGGAPGVPRHPSSGFELVVGN